MLGRHGGLALYREGHGDGWGRCGELMGVGGGGALGGTRRDRRDRRGEAVNVVGGCCWGNRVE